MVTRFYYFLRQEDSASPTQVIYKISVSRSMREYNALHLLEQFALETGAVICPVNEISDRMLQQRAEAILPGRQYPRMYFRSAQLSVLSLYKLIETNKLDEFEHSLPITRAQRKFLDKDSSSNNLSTVDKAKQPICHAEPRKYLSRWGLVCPKSVALKCLCVIVLFLLSGCLEGLEKSLY